MTTMNKKEYNEFKMQILNALSKLNDNYTVKIGQEILKSIILKEQNSEKKINHILIMISENIHGLKLDDKKESIKILSFVSQTLQTNEKYISKILTILQTIITEENSKYFNVISDTYGEIIENSWNMDLEDDKKRKIYELLQGFCMYNLKLESKSNQICGCYCLTKLISICPLVTTGVYLKYIWETILSLIDDPKFYPKNEILETIVGLIFATEIDFKPYASICLFKILDFLMNPDWIKRKISLDIIYALSNFCKEEIFPLKSHIIDFLKPLKTDSVKQVREVCLVTLNYLNEREKTSPSEIKNPKESLVKENKNILNKIIEKQEENDDLFFDISEIRKPDSIKNDDNKKEARVGLTQKKDNPRTNKKMQIKQIPQKQKKTTENSSNQDSKQKKQTNSIFKGPVNKEFFINAPKDTGIEIKFKEKENIYSTPLSKEIPIQEEDIDEMVPVGSNYINDIEQNICKKDDLVHIINEKETENEEKLAKKETFLPKNNENVNNNEILKQMKLMSEKQILLIDTLENLQKSSSEQIKAMNKRINELENLLITLTSNHKQYEENDKYKDVEKSIQLDNKYSNMQNNSLNNYLKEESDIKLTKHENPTDINDIPIQVEKDLHNKTWSEIELKLKNNNPNDAILLTLKRNDKKNLLRLIENLSIFQIREISTSTLEECISKILNLLTKGESVSLNLQFIKNLIINHTEVFKEKIMFNIRDVVNFLLKNKSLYNFTEDDICDMNILISLIKFKCENQSTI